MRAPTTKAAGRRKGRAGLGGAGHSVGDVSVRAPRLADGTIAPLLQRTDLDFLPSIYAELQRGAPAAALADSVASTRDNGVLQLYRPVHRVFNVALFEVACDRPGQPPLDPRSIESAGLVIRRVANAGATRHAGWLQAPDVARGWIALDGPDEATQDPDPARRPPAVRSGHPVIDERLARASGAARLRESVVPLFVAPPAVCAAAGRTLLVGVLPTGSAEESKQPAATAVYDRPTTLARVPALMRDNGGARRTPPLAGQVLTRADVTDSRLADFIGGLGRLVVGFGLNDPSDEGAALRAQLEGLDVLVDGDSISLLQAVNDAAAVLLFGGTGSFVMPDRWAAVSSADEAALVDALMAAANRKLAQIRPRQARFEDDSALYQARAFVRVRQDPGPSGPCPPKLVWSAYTEPFRIAPWWKTGPAAPPVIALPDPLGGNLKDFAPNVSFKLPPRLFEVLNRNSPDDFLGGKATTKGVGLGLQWICSLNVPIITLCAFIVLFIFLALFHLLFWWLPFVRVCVPVPSEE